MSYFSSEGCLERSFRNNMDVIAEGRRHARNTVQHAIPSSAVTLLQSYAAAAAHARGGNWLWVTIPRTHQTSPSSSAASCCITIVRITSRMHGCARATDGYCHTRACLSASDTCEHRRASSGRRPELAMLRQRIMGCKAADILPMELSATVSRASLERSSGQPGRSSRSSGKQGKRRALIYIRKCTYVVRTPRSDSL